MIIMAVLAIIAIFWNMYGGNFILKEHVVVQPEILPKTRDLGQFLW